MQGQGGGNRCEGAVAGEGQAVRRGKSGVQGQGEGDRCGGAVAGQGQAVSTVWASGWRPGQLTVNQPVCDGLREQPVSVPMKPETGVHRRRVLGLHGDRPAGREELR